MLDKKIRWPNFLMMFFIGALGGFFGTYILLPWLAQFVPLSGVGWIKNAREGTTVINQTQNLIITENEAVEKAIMQAKNSIVGIRAERLEKNTSGKNLVLALPEVLAQGTGIIVSNDGLVVTAEILVPMGAQKILVIFEDRELPAEVKKRDQASGLVLLKINENNLPVLPFRESGLKLGEQVFLIGADLKAGLNKFIELGSVSEIGAVVSIDFSRQDISGSPIFDVKSEITGMNIINKNGKLSMIPAPTIRDLMK